MRKCQAAAVAALLVATGCGSKTSGHALSVDINAAGSRLSLVTPASVSGGVTTVRLRNQAKDPHQVVFIRVDGNHTQAEVAKAIMDETGPIPSWAHIDGGVSDVAPGKSGSATLNLEPGSYFVADPGTDDNNNYFVAAGAIEQLQVTGKASGSLPSAAATITAKEYSFGVPALKAGTTTVRFENVGHQPHLLAAFPINPGKTIDDVRRDLASQGPPQGPPAVDFQKSVGAQGLDPGRSELTDLRLEAGRYAFVCFLRDRNGGPPHVTLGMLQEVRVS